MRLLVEPEKLIPTCMVGDKCAIPATLLADGKARLYRIDIFSEYGTLKHLSPQHIVVLTRFVTWFLDDTFFAARICNTSFPGCEIMSNGTYDGFVLKITSLANIPVLSHSRVHHTVTVTTTPYVCKLAVVGPARFHPLRVSSNVPMTFPVRTSLLKQSACFHNTAQFWQWYQLTQNHLELWCGAIQ